MFAPPPIIARRQQSENPYFRIFADELELPSGQLYTYHAMECVHAAVLVVPVLGDGRMVVERVYRHPYRQRLLEFPAGGIDDGEDPLAAAARELEEETGYRAAALRSLGSVEPLPGLVRMRLHLVLAQGLTAGASLRREPLEMMEVLVCTVDELERAAGEEPVSGFLLFGLEAWRRHGR